MKKHGKAFLKLVTETRKKVREIHVKDIFALLTSTAERDFILIDVREAEEFQRGHIPGAIHIGKGVLERDIETFIPDPSSKLYLYCGGGYRSVLAADAIVNMGYVDVVSLDGGWRAWCQLQEDKKPESDV